MIAGNVIDDKKCYAQAQDKTGKKPEHRVIGNKSFFGGPPQTAEKKCTKQKSGNKYK
jgi:hypothetical protein